MYYSQTFYFFVLLSEKCRTELEAIPKVPIFFCKDNLLYTCLKTISTSMLRFNFHFDMQDLGDLTPDDLQYFMYTLTVKLCCEIKASFMVDGKT